MGKFGKKNVVSRNINDYSIALLGEPGVGKTTIISNVCHKLFGDDGYILLDIGKEQGVDAIEGIVYEEIPDWKKFDEVTKDIIKNKKTDYPNLKVVVIDSLDQMIDIAEPETIRRWNRENMGKQGFEPAKSLNSAFGGFGNGQDYNCNMILDRVWELKSVGVTTWYVGHTRTRDIVDPITSATYTTLTTDMSQRDFAAFKNKVHVVGIACIDRTIETESTGRKNIVTHKDITINKVKSENRKIVFRDDNYSVDSKSRFANIVNEIPMNADTFIKAIQDAIDAEANKHDNNPVVSAESHTSGTTNVNRSGVQATTNVNEEASIQVEDANVNDLDDIGMNAPVDEKYEYPENLKDAVIALYKSCKVTDTKNEAKAFISKFGKLSNVDEEGLRYLYDILRK